MKNFILSMLLVASVIAVGCSSDTPKESSDLNTEPEQIVNRIRPAAEGGTTAAYFIYKNPLEVADTLLSVESPVAEMAQVHQTYETEDGMMGMMEQTDIYMGPGEEIVFEQGGLHIMLMHLKHTIAEGDSVLVKLHFVEGGKVELMIPVKPE